MPLAKTDGEREEIIRANHRSCDESCAVCFLLRRLVEARIAPVNALAPVDQLRGSKPLVLYFSAAADREAFIMVFEGIYPDARAIRL